MVPAELAAILKGTPELSRSYLVGGCVRDWLLGIPQKDFDVEVYGISCDKLVDALRRWGRTDSVGRSFGVIKLTTGSGREFDFTIPRRDSKVGPGHRGFEISFDPIITPREASERRDFTINALMFDPRTGETLDFFGGQDDLRNRVLRHVSNAFCEDPLRVLRGMQLTARFGLEAADETLSLCRKIKDKYAELAVERIRDEWFKWASKSARPSAGLRFLLNSAWIEHFPEIQALIGTPQEPEWHPEGDVFVHTCHCCDAMVNLPSWQNADWETRIVLSLAILAHDFGKPSTTERTERGGRIRIVSPGHEEAGTSLTAIFLERIKAPLAIRERVIPLVGNHLAHLQTINPRSVRRLARRLAPATIQELCVVINADQFGRPPRPQELSETLLRLQAQAAELDLEARAPKPVLLGRHLISLGMEPGAEMGRILQLAFEAQIEGEFGTLQEAMTWLAAQKTLLSETIVHKIRNPNQVEP